MNNREALLKSYEILSPYADRQRWEFSGNLYHINFLTTRIKKDDDILDAGSGIGILTLALKLLGYKVEGMDKYVFKPDNEFFSGDLAKLKQIWLEQKLSIIDKDFLSDDADKKYRVIVSIATLEHQTNIKLFFERLLSYLEKGGFIYIDTPNITNLLNRFRVLLGRSPLGNIEDFFRNGENFNGHWREYSMEELKKMSELAGIQIIKAINPQTQKAKLDFSSPRRVYLNLFRLLSLLVPGARDANIIWGRKQQTD